MVNPFAQRSFSILFALSGFLFASSATEVWGQVSPPEPPYVNLGRIPVTTGLPQLNLGYPTETVIDPDVGQIVRLARGFDFVPDFTYAFTHPLARFTDPLAYQGPFGAANTPLTPGGEPPNSRPQVNTPSVSPQTTVQLGAHDPPMNTRLLPQPWHVASQQAEYLPKLGAYAHYTDDSEMKGAYVTGIAVNSAAHKAGLLPGDVITAINGQDLKSRQAYQDALDRLTKPWSVQVWNAHTNRVNTLKSTNEAAPSETAP